jgi:hypothetical protein
MTEKQAERLIKAVEAVASNLGFIFVALFFLMLATCAKV